MTGFEPADLHHGEVALFLLSYIRVEPARGVEPRPPPYRGGMLPLSPNRHQSWPGWSRTSVTP